MKNQLMNLTVFAAAGLLTACTVIGMNRTPEAAQAFPTATNSYLFEGNAPVRTPESLVSLSGAPTIASVFRGLPSASPSAVVTSTLTPEPESTATASPRPQFYTAAVYEEDLNTNWEVLPDTRLRFDLKSSGDVYRGKTAISFAPRRPGGADLFITVSDQSQEEYRRDQVAKLSFWLYSPKTVLYLDQFFITFVGSKHLPYWSAEDQKVSDYLSVFSKISLDELGFDRAVPADTWVMVEIDLTKARALATEYQYLTGISFKNATDPAQPLLIDDISLILLDEPPTRSPLEITPTAR
jgi:hypothetical protein